MVFRFVGMSFFSAMVAMAVNSAAATDTAAWKVLGDATLARSSGIPGDRWMSPASFTLAEASPELLQQKLGGAGKQILEIPSPAGGMVKFEIEEYQMLEAPLADAFPNVRTFRGTAVGDPNVTIYGDWTPQGFHAAVVGPNICWYVDPYIKGNDKLHVSYRRQDARRTGAWMCGTQAKAPLKLTGPVPAPDTLAPPRKAFRLACAATGEYTTFHGGTAILGQAAIITAINRVNQIYERDLGFTMVLVANNQSLVFTNPSTDPYTNDDAFALLDENQAEVDAVIGSANYDVGHVFSTGGGGLASLGVICNSSFKAQGETGSSSPVGDPFYVDYVAHELGHQFGANHTFAGNGGACSGNENPGTAVEPGSGTTIMAYAGICSADDLQSNSDPFFHAASLDEIRSYINSTACASNTDTGNSLPNVAVPAGVSIPKQTPFVLTASASDPDSDPITYCWEQMDAAVTGALTNPDNGTGPLFRSFSPTTSTQRTFPKLSTILNNATDDAEKLPAVGRSMKMRVTVRDGRGGVSSVQTTYNVVSTAGPFVVTNPNAAGSFSGPLTVTWNVANTNVTPVSTANVNILLSTDGGNTFPTVLVSNTPNDGSEAVTLPNVASTSARIKVEAVNNVFFDVSDQNFTIEATPGNLDVQGAGQPIPSGSTTPSIDNLTQFGPVFPNPNVDQSLQKTFQLRNTGGGDISLSDITISGNAFAVVSPNVFPVVIAPASSVNLVIDAAPQVLGPVTGTVTISSNDPDTSSYTFIVAATGQSSANSTLEKSDELTTTVGWQELGIPDAALPILGNPVGLGSRGYDAANTALLMTLTTNTQTRVVGWREDAATDIPYFSIGTDKVARASFAIYSVAVPTPEALPSTSTVFSLPNFRIRLMQRFVINSMLEVNHNSGNTDPAVRNLAREFSPSNDPAAPSVYTVDLDPVDIPYLLGSAGATEGVQRGVEAVGEVSPLLPDYQYVQGTLALTDSSVGTYPIPNRAQTPVKVYATGTTDFTNSDVTLTKLQLDHDPLASGIVSGLSLETSLTLTKSTAGITVDSTLVPASKVAIAAVDFLGGNGYDQTHPESRLRIDPERLYKISFRISSTGLTTSAPQIRLRARTAKFQWTHKLELGGAAAVGSAAGRAIIAEAMPGTNSQNLDSDGSGQWYHVWFTSPLQPTVRADVAGAIVDKFPLLMAQPGNGDPTNQSVRDLKLGFDVIDTLSFGVGYEGEVAKDVNLNRIEIRDYPQPDMTVAP